MITNYGWECGGGEVYVFNLKKTLESMGHEVLLFSSDDSSDIKILQSDIIFKNYKNKIFKSLASLINFRSMVKLRGVIKNFEPDVIHIHSMLGQVTSTVTWATYGVPVLMTIHSRAEFYPDDDLRGLIKIYETINAFIRRNTIATRNVNLFTAPSKYMVSVVPGRIKPITVSGIGMELFDYSPINNTKSLLFVGRVEKYKGVYVLLSAMQLVLKTIPDAKLTIVGDGSELDNLKKIIVSEELEKNILTVGNVEHHKLQKYYSESTVVIVPSLVKESFGLTIIEAFSAGRPVIGSNAGGIPELIMDGTNGKLFNSGDAVNLANEIISLLEDSETLEQMGRNAKNSAIKYSMNNNAKYLVDTYSSIIKP